ncbi:hypothetical protein E3E35_05085 [Thermococcus sp. GR7]|uniref:hypothetical protein n=1 Tax=unclassified Thermococcus TaxID=2627626 RepID=UPI00142F8564|nr:MULTISPECIES: hypothetical protein [unclassified Thermococcus]NJE46795.1 hypothetical protein [Thermococcus sp. GR7]NJE77777.1 hypothetical protein [Thermococcus sp. GR4]NJF23411.1 hypothetical protein [Thermococcus sp. GR5]
MEDVGSLKLVHFNPLSGELRTFGEAFSKSFLYSQTPVVGQSPTGENFSGEKFHQSSYVLFTRFAPRAFAFKLAFDMGLLLTAPKGRQGKKLLEGGINGRIQFLHGL